MDMEVDQGFRWGDWHAGWKGGWHGDEDTWWMVILLEVMLDVVDMDVEKVAKMVKWVMAHGVSPVVVF